MVELDRPIKLIAIDLDGTLSTNLPQIPPQTRQALTATIAQGVKIALATGRPYPMAAQIARDLDLNAPVIVYQGAVVRDPWSEETLHAETMPLAVSRRLIKFARDKKLHLVLYMADGNYTELPSNQMEQAVGREGVPLLIVHNLLAVLGDETKPIKGVFVQPRSKNEAVYQLLKDQFSPELTVLRSADILVEALWPTVSKGNGLRLLAERFGVSPDETMAIGDQDNDISMLQAAGLGVAMGNGSEGAKAAADVLAPSVEEAGVAWALQRYVLDGKHDPNT